MSTYRCPNCQAVVQRASICTRCGAPQSVRVLRGFTVAVVSALAIGLFGGAIVMLQNAGVHRRIDHNHTVGDWSDYDEDDEGNRTVRSNAPSIFSTLSSPDAGIW
jgi:hypothetical protein